MYLVLFRRQVFLIIEDLILFYPQEESSRVAVDDDEEKVQFWIDTAGDKAPALAAKKDEDEDDDMKQLHAIAEMFKIKQFNAKRKLEIPKEDDNSSPAKKAKKVRNCFGVMSF